VLTFIAPDYRPAVRALQKGWFRIWLTYARVATTFPIRGPTGVHENAKSERGVEYNFLTSCHGSHRALLSGSPCSVSTRKRWLS